MSSSRRKQQPKDEEAPSQEPIGGASPPRRLPHRLLRGLSWAKKHNFEGKAGEAIYSKRHRVLILARVLLAVPGPAFLVFSGVQHMQAVDEDMSTAWGMSWSFTQLQTGKNFAICVGFLTVPLWIMSLLVAQIEEKPSADTNIEKKPSADTPATAPIAVNHDSTPIERLVRLLKWDERIWSWPKAFEAFLFFGSVYGYAALYNTTTLSGVLGIYLLGTPIALLVLKMITTIVRSCLEYQYDQKVDFHTFVNLQAYRLSIHTIFALCVATYAMSAMSRVVVPSNQQEAFDELSLKGITCTDRVAFWTAFHASAANASCPALPNCGYASFDDLCQAVQYTPMVRAVGVDSTKVLLFNWVAWLLISLLVFGTGRASANNGYAQLLTRHMLVAMVLGLAQLAWAFYSFMRLLLNVPMLRLPRPAAYFDRTDSMARELPLYFYGTFTFYDFWGSIFVHVLIAVLLNFDFLKKYASAIGAGGQKAVDELKEEMRQSKQWERAEWSDEAPYFYFLPRQVVLDCKTRSLPPMQALRDVGHLEKIPIPLSDAFNGKAFSASIDKKEIRGILINKDILFVSHRWEEPGRPDVDGVQLEAIKEYLQEHDEIRWVWFDYSSMPQKTGGFAFDTRTLKEKAEFQLMLSAIADLYLTAQVLILLVGSYASRFWTLTEAWCSMQTATAEGLKPATEERRYTIKCIHTADEKHDVEGLVEKVSKKTPKQIFDHLSKPDVNVTNAKDKQDMLPVIQKTDEHVIEGFKNGFKDFKEKPRQSTQQRSGRQSAGFPEFPAGSPLSESPPAQPKQRSFSRARTETLPRSELLSV